MNSNLVLTIVTDKNGVITKRWVKPSSSGVGVPVRAIPSLQYLATPVSLSGISRSALQKELRRAFHDYGDHDDFSFDDIAQLIKRCEDHTLRLVTLFIQKDGNIDHDRVTVAADILQAYSYDKIMINEVLHYHDAFPDRTVLQFREEAVRKLHKHKYDGLPELDDYSLADEDTQTEVRRLLKSAGDYYAETYVPEYSSFDIILSEEMRNFISNNMDRIDRIDEIMIERGTEDPVLVKTILDSDTTSISSGIL